MGWGDPIIMFSSCGWGALGHTIGIRTTCADVGSNCVLSLPLALLALSSGAVYY